MKIAVIGAGVFGSTTAIYAARAGYDVHLFDELFDILQAASGINQYRLHHGYHYPRSSNTARSAREAERSFREEYEQAILDGGRHLYAIAKEKSLVNGEEFLAFCEVHHLAARRVSVPELVNPEMIDLVIEADEARFDPGVLRNLVRQKLKESRVTVHLGVAANDIQADDFDTIIVAAYAGTNRVFKALGLSEQEYQFEVCEKPVVTLPSAFKQTDLVIMDGPFMCVDPLGTTGQYVLGNVVHAIHATNTGIAPVVPSFIVPFLNRGVVSNPSGTRFRDFIESGAPFIPLLSEAKHIGSMFTIRTVFPRLDATDARPTLVSSINGRYIHILSGKIGNCVLAAREALKMIGRK